LSLLGAAARNDEILAVKAALTLGPANHRQVVALARGLAERLVAAGFLLEAFDGRLFESEEDGWTGERLSGWSLSRTEQ
jgi:hypothetical protein